MKETNGIVCSVIQLLYVNEHILFSFSYINK